MKSMILPKGTLCHRNGLPFFLEQDAAIDTHPASFERMKDDFKPETGGPLNWPTLDPIAPTPPDRQGFEPREYCERS